MSRYDLLIQLDVRFFSEIVTELVHQSETPEKLEERLLVEVTKEELQQINGAALKEGYQQLSSSFKQ